VDSAIGQLKENGTIYETDGALFLKSTDYGDDRDRCVVRNNGKPTYIASDIAYHKDKFDRGYEYLIDIFGPDHHGYVERTYAAVEALGYGRDKLKIIITQMVRFIKDGKPAPMRKRNGEFYRLSDLMDELGSDVVRFFYLMRSQDTHMDFDLDLALEHSDKNPVFYAQYATSNLGTAYFRDGRYADAARAFERACELTPSDYRVWRNLGAALYWAPGERDKATAAFSRAVALGEEARTVNPRQPALLAQLADAYSMLGDRQSATAAAVAVERLGTSDPDAAFNVANAYEQLGERDQALRWLEQALATGYSRDAVERSPSLAELRKDPRFDRRTRQR
jgi:tetratricopeptide (TPR) repeat protein